MLTLTTDGAIVTWLAGEGGSFTSLDPGLQVRDINWDIVAIGVTTETVATLCSGATRRARARNGAEHPMEASIMFAQP